MLGITEKESKIREQDAAIKIHLCGHTLSTGASFDIATIKMLRRYWLAYPKDHFSTRVSCLLSKILHCNKEKPVFLRTLNSSTALVIQECQSILEKKEKYH